MTGEKKSVRLGLDTFGDRAEGANGELNSYAQVIRDVVEEIVLADRAGVDAFTVGEHHRPDFAVSSPEMVLAAAAGLTERVTLGSGVTVLSSDDPVRVFERFATLDAVSNGRAEVVLGRGSFTESFPLFGFDLRDYDLLFEEKLDLFVKLLREQPVTWEGRTRPALSGQSVFPATEPNSLKTWVGVGGSPESVVRAARYELPLMLAIIGGSPERFQPLVSLYRHALERFGHAQLELGVHSPGYVASTDDQAREEFWPYFKEGRDRIGAERGWPSLTREAFEREADSGSLYIGSPTTVAQKIAHTVEVLGVDRFDLKYSAGRLPHSLAMHNIELFGSEVAPLVRSALADREARPAPAAMSS